MQTGGGSKSRKLCERKMQNLTWDPIRDQCGEVSIYPEHFRRRENIALGAPPPTLFDCRRRKRRSRRRKSGSATGRSSTTRTGSGPTRRPTRSSATSPPSRSSATTERATERWVEERTNESSRSDVGPRNGKLQFQRWQ